MLAVSGGIDSVCLAHVLAGLGRQRGFELALGHVNHGLRGAESDADEAAVRDLAAKLGVAVYGRSVRPDALREGCSSRERPTRQEAARTLRYKALREIADDWGATRLVTAHNADDQLETVLLRLLRGCGPAALAGIRVRSQDGFLLRPMLEVPRSLIQEYAGAAGLCWREDSSNASLRYTRNRLRREILPLLREHFNPHLSEAVGRLARAQERDRDWIEGLVEVEAARRFCERDGVLQIDCRGWQALPEALALRLARQALAQWGAARDVRETHLKRFSRFLAGAAPGRVLELPAGLRVRVGARHAVLYRVKGNRPC